MEIEGRPLGERVIEAIVVFGVLLAFAWLQESYDWVVLVATPVAFFAFVIVFDAVRRRASD